MPWYWRPFQDAEGFYSIHRAVWMAEICWWRLLSHSPPTGCRFFRWCIVSVLQNLLFVWWKRRKANWIRDALTWLPRGKFNIFGHVCMCYAFLCMAIMHSYESKPINMIFMKCDTTRNNWKIRKFAYPWILLFFSPMNIHNIEGTLARLETRHDILAKGVGVTTGGNRAAYRATMQSPKYINKTNKGT